MSEFSYIRGSLEIQRREDGSGGNLTVAGRLAAGEIAGLRSEAVITGDGATARFVIRHGLGVVLPGVMVYDAQGQRVHTAVLCPSDGTIILDFAEPPSAGESYRVVCHQ